MDPTIDTPSGGDSRRLDVPAELDGVRLDRALASLVADFSRERLREMVEDGRVRVGGATLRKPSHAVAEGDRVEIDLVPRDRTRPGSSAGPDLAIVHEDEHILVVDKPVDMVVHPSTVVRGGTLSELCSERFGPLPAIQGEDRPGIVHRLDKDTSGLVVLARTEAAGVELLRQFREREVEKTYLALVFGDPRFETEWITTPIGRVPGKGERMTVLPDGGGRAAETYYEVRERFGGFALVECRPTTGRTHQIRVHMASVEHPIVGDMVYRVRKHSGRGLPKDAPKLQRQALHAHALAFRHPADGRRVRFEAPLPADMRAVVEFLRLARKD
jgi:23S rRNA pseudouridine1911/1915/1917 synthase